MFDRVSQPAQVKALGRSALRNLPKRFAAVQVMIIGLWLAGHPVLAGGLFLGLCAAELAALWVIKTTPEPPDISQGKIGAYRLVGVVLGALYFMPGILLAFHPDPGLALAGGVWVLTVLFANLAMDNAARPFFWTAGLPSILCTLFMVAFGTVDVGAEPGISSWAICAGVAAIGIVNTWQHFQNIRDTQFKFDALRAELLEAQALMTHISLSNQANDMAAPATSPDCAPGDDQDGNLPAERRAALEAALCDQRIAPFYQAQYQVTPSRLRETTCVALEALARWPQDHGDALTAENFIPDLAKMGLLPEVTCTMLSQVLADLARWERQGIAPDKVSLNIPAAVLASDESVQSLMSCILEYRAIAGRLAFEITEDIYAASKRDMIAENLSGFRELGVEIHLDDFGTGHASYQHLRATRPDVIKIDGSLVAELGTGTPAEVVIKGFTSIAQGVGARIVAEQVETEMQRDILLSLGVRTMQGHLFSHALPAHHLALPGRAAAS